MTLLEYITDLQSQGLSGEEIFAKAQEFKGRTKPEEVVEEVKTEVVPGKVAPVATTPETATEGIFSESIYGNEEVKTDVVVDPVDAAVATKPEMHPRYKIRN